ncbi:hypothetical protein V2W45_1230984, partial [Cenococcum geophilum]
RLCAETDCLRASSIPSEYQHHSLDCSRGNVSAEYVNPYEVEYLLNPIIWPGQLHVFDTTNLFEDSLLVRSSDPPCSSPCSLKNIPESTAASQTSDSVLPLLVPSISSSGETFQTSGPISYVIATSPSTQISISPLPAPTGFPFAPRESGRPQDLGVRSPYSPPLQASRSASSEDSVSTAEINPSYESTPNIQVIPAVESISGEQPPYRCDLCEEVFEKRHLRNNHRNRKHTRRYKCPVENCQQKAFGLKRDLDRHLTSRHPKQYPCAALKCPYSGCRLANKIFPREDNLKRHIRTCHDTPGSTGPWT